MSSDKYYPVAGPTKPNRMFRRSQPMDMEFEEARNIPTDWSKLTRYISVDCEMVSCGKRLHMGRVTVVNESGDIVLDKYVRVRDPVTNYHTRYSGLTAQHLAIGEDFDAVSDELYEMASNHILVGHSLKNDIRVMFPDRPPPENLQMRDLSLSVYLKHLVNKKLPNGQYKMPSLRELTNTVLKRDIQCGMHSSLVDARAAMEIFQRHKADIECPPF